MSSFFRSTTEFLLFHLGKLLGVILWSFGQIKLRFWGASLSSSATTTCVNFLSQQQSCCFPFYVASLPNRRFSLFSGLGFQATIPVKNQEYMVRKVKLALPTSLVHVKAHLGGMTARHKSYGCLVEVALLPSQHKLVLTHR